MANKNRLGELLVREKLISLAQLRQAQEDAQKSGQNLGHTLAKLLLPGGVAPDAACRLVSVTHPDYVRLMREIFALTPGDALVMRGGVGEAAVRLHAPQPIEEMRGSEAPIEYRLDASDANYALPDRDPQATADWTREVLAGHRIPPAAIVAQAALIARHCRR